MVVGFNHNFRYKGELFHIQTEDSGLKSPNIVTLLYKQGTILASKKTSYADITKIDQLERVVEELMKEQHREMLRRLKEGEFDAKIALHRPATPGETSGAAELTPEVIEEAAAPAPEAAPTPQPATAAPKPPPTPEKEAKSTVELGLDEIILSYLVGDDKK